MPTLTIDGQEVTVEAGTSVIQAAEKVGIYIPRYCYHPGLTIAGSCRMCLVEMENMPKLQIACYTPVADGQKIVTTSEKVRVARKSMLEFLLTNHPLDCPVCDQSGECDLQNFYMEYGRYESRFREDKIKRKKAHPLGPHVVLDQERCILCTRCTRFTEQITETHELGVFNRGNRSVIDLHPDKHLDNNYSGNVIDICPVGALTEREFRFKCRVWYLSTANSICTGCSRGCNITIHYNKTRSYKAGGKRIQRLKPRFNPHVNQWWMSDQGRFGFEFIDKNRIEFPSLRRGGQLLPADWETVTSEVASALKNSLERFGPSSIGIIASPQQSNEELYLVRKIFGELLGVPHISFRNPWEAPGPEDDFLLRSDRNPNSRGAEAIGLDGDTAAILQKAASGEIKVLYIFGHDLDVPEARESLEKAEYVIFQGTNWQQTARASHAVLAGATHAEKEGTFTNFEGRVQFFEQAVNPLEDSRKDVEILVSLAEKLGHPLVYLGAEDLYMEWQGKTYPEMGPFGDASETSTT